MSNTFYCQLRQQDVTYKNCKRQRILTADRTIEFCSECMEAGLWREYQESPDPVVAGPAKPEPKPKPKPIKNHVSKPTIEVMSAQQKRVFKLGRKCETCGKLIADYNQSGICSKCRNKKGLSYKKGLVCTVCGKPIIDNNASGICRTCQRKGRQYHKKNLVCKECGKSVSDRSKSGLCLSCSAKNAFENSPSGRKYLKRKNKAEPKVQSIIVEANDNQFAQLVPELVEKAETQPEQLMFAMSPNSLGAAKIAIEQAFYDQERFRALHPLLLQLENVEAERGSILKRIRELVA